MCQTGIFIPVLATTFVLIPRNSDDDRRQQRTHARTGRDLLGAPRDCIGQIQMVAGVFQPGKGIQFLVILVGGARASVPSTTNVPFDRSVRVSDSGFQIVVRAGGRPSTRQGRARVVRIGQ